MNKEVQAIKVKATVVDFRTMTHRVVMKSVTAYEMSKYLDFYTALMAKLLHELEEDEMLSSIIFFYERR